MVDFMVQLFPYTLFALIATMMIFLAVKGRASTVVLNVAVIVQAVVTAMTYAIAVDTSRSGSMIVGFAIMLVIFFYIIPSMVMLNFVLYAIVFDSIVDGLKGKLKLLTVASLVSYGMVTCVAFFDRQITNWLEQISTFLVAQWIHAILFYVIAALLILCTFIAHWWMLIYAIKTTKEPAKKVWSIIAFCFPIVGSAIYLFVQLICKIKNHPTRNN